VHTFPVDSVILGLFDGAGVIDAGIDEAQLASRLEREIRAGDAAGSFSAFEIAALKPAPPVKKPRTAKKTAAKKTAKKPTKKTGRKTA